MMPAMLPGRLGSCGSVLERIITCMGCSTADNPQHISSSKGNLA
jgi:hypothetical protein